MSDELIHLETVEDLTAFQKRVEKFMEDEGINCLNINEDSEPYFSWNYCECCKRPLGGVHYDAMGFNPHKHQVQGPYEVCFDCIHYVEYGQVDDMTFMEIKENENKEKK